MTISSSSEYSNVVAAPNGKHLTQDASIDSRGMLAKMGKLAKSWLKLAQVKRIDLDAAYAFDPEKPDFMPNLLPFAEHPLYVNASPEMKQRILSFGWLIYNWKTVEIEEKLISPICNKILHGDIPGQASASMSEVIGQTLVDEAYHILMVIKACEYTMAMRDLPRMNISSEFELVTSLQKEQARYLETWKHDMVQLAISIVSEVFISDYLTLLSNAHEIQPINRMVVTAHRRDEFRHSPIFKHIAQDAYANMNDEQKAFFCDVLPKPVRWFVSRELKVWRSVLEQLGFEGTDKLIDDTMEASRDELLRIDYSELITLAQEIGILDTAIGADSFHREGLIS